MAGSAGTGGRPLLRLTAAVALLLAACGEAAAPVTVEPAPAPTDAAGPDAVVRALAQGLPTVVEFGANVCAACRDMKQVLAELRRTHGERLRVAEVDPLAHRDYAARHRVNLMPTQIFYDARGTEIGRNVGRIDGPSILARLRLDAGPR